jgi:hypothetical protein
MPSHQSAIPASNPEQPGQEMPYSVVFLLRGYLPLSEQHFQLATEHGWGVSFDGKRDPMYFVSVSGEHGFVKAGKHVIKLLSVSQSYLGTPDEIAEQLPRQEQQSAWRNHRAWVALDFWNLELPKIDAYEMLARLSLPLLSDQCCGVFLPKEEVFMPNDGTAQEGLQLLLERSLF